MDFETPTQEPKSGQGPIHWDKTAQSTYRLSFKEGWQPPTTEAPLGYWQGRPIIGRDTPIGGGVYLGEEAREAIVVTKDGEKTERIFQKLLKKTRPRDQSTEPPERATLETTFDITRRALKWNDKKVAKLLAENNIKQDRKVALEGFVRAGVGVCRHTALLAGYYIEKLIAEGRLHGNVSVDRNYIDQRGGHAWVRYTNPAGQVVILDPARNYLGSLEDAPEDARWIYERPGKVA
ncbi:hypothetical protein HY933_04535 [Candidatus Falkowbacteria bacterium]|nr:hypothetical protein [Candidatus Falkowbacteria bacterium]